MSSTRSTPTDRKSTRLNSSHSSISYAVFCLKKKKYRQNVFTSLNINEIVHHFSVELHYCQPVELARVECALQIGSRFSTVLFFFNDTATTEIYTLSLHDALPI